MTSEKDTGVATNTAVAVRGLTVRYDSLTALEDLDFEIPPGAAVAILGPNGCGKSTLLLAVLGLIEKAAGYVRLGSSRVSFVPQDLRLEPSFPLTVSDVVRMGRWRDLGRLRRLRAHDDQMVAQALAALQIQDIADQRLGDLSGGQRQRTLLAQAVAEDSDILLLDEPFTGVDRPTRNALGKLIAKWRNEGRTVVVATHDLESAARDYDLVLCLNRRLVKFGPAAETCSEEILRETFSGHVARIGESVFDTGHHHPGAA